MRSKLFVAVTMVVFTSSMGRADQIVTVDDALGNLGTVDVQTGVAHVIGNMGVVMTDIAFSPTGVLYGLSFTDLYTIDPLTASVHLIDPHSIPSGNALVFDTSGTLYGAGAGSSLLFTVNPATGAATSIGNDGFASAGDLTFNNGSVFLSSTGNDLIKINLAGTVTGTIVGPLGSTNVFGLATGSDGVLYGVAGTQTFSVNTATGAGSLLNNYFGQGLGVANGSSFITEAGGGTPSVPEPATVFLTIAALCIVLASRFLQRHVAGKSPKGV